MSDTFKYSLIQNKEGNFVVESTIKSFNLDQITEKDIVSFYKNFSQVSSFDTGLLPVDGTGVLSIRSAGPHMQIAVQHKPGEYLINWGAVEGDRHAKTYRLAQPYRIIIGDFVNGNLLGAKMFYSPYPITHPEMQLYHVNLPNINCRGYRGNAVGWICLYHKEDWSALSFSEKVSRLIERCSGVETYNDGNMSETDGPRFYQQNQKPPFTYDPSAWEQMTSDSGYEWTLNPDLWIPVMVKSIDLQSQHHDAPDAIPLTFAGSILGNYQAYYTDSDIPKLYNVMSRPDLNITNKHIADMVKSSFARSEVISTFQPKDNPYEFTVKQRDKNGSTQLVLQFTNDDDDEHMWICHCCEDEFEGESDYSDHEGNSLCNQCFENDYVYVETVGEYFNQGHPLIHWSENLNSYIHIHHDTLESCERCGEDASYHGSKNTKHSKLYPTVTPFMSADGNEYNTVCKDCIADFANENGFALELCSCKKTQVITDPFMNDVFPSHHSIIPVFDDKLNVTYVSQTSYYCNFCLPVSENLTVCPCGIINNKENFDTANCKATVITSGDNGEIITTVSSCCTTCLSNPVYEDGILISQFEPQNPELFQEYLKNSSPTKLKKTFGIEQSIDYNKIQF
ncbi:hypothetical protein UFOVP784_237 [uncultured Caudovirales phage]|uniref:Uncharacterized protein n=1 Tax=uncultured Caudovirales phage TaxID=2100421 RepID=A0A6J5P0Y8_9CAUD|nr:hypothetical protein UFOVP436_237 [uncultured Caudovirales phage]CAB4163021.1 hypothetical protein UFOVP784_237 [uncultured Caudovirales phage]